MRVGPSLDQLRRDPHGITRLAHGTFQHVCHVQRARDLGDPDLLALECERRGARGHLQLRNLGEQIQQFFGDTVGKVLVRLLVAHVHERQHGDRLRRCRYRCFLVDTVVQHEAVGHQQHDRDSHDRDDREVELAAGVVCDRLVRLDLALALQAFRREFVEPSERDPQRKADHRRDEKPARCPLRRTDRRAQLGNALRQRPDRRDIERSRAQHVAALEFGQQAALHADPAPLPVVTG
jgi:hypothetical protein